MTGSYDDLAPLGDLAGRGIALRRYIRNQYDRDGDRAWLLQVAELLRLAVEAACVPDLEAAGECLAEAETLTGQWKASGAARNAEHNAAQQAASAALRMAKARDRARAESERGDVPVTDTVAVVTAGLRGRVPVTSPDPFLIVAADGAYSGRYYGWAYVTGNGRWGMQGQSLGADPSGALLAELAAARMAVCELAAELAADPAAVLLSDSRSALGFAAAWQAGGETLPVLAAGDKKAPRRAQVAESARKVLAQYPGLQLVHVGGHRGHLLNEAADSLAKMARRWRAGEDRAAPEQMRRRADDLVAAFMRSWHGVPPPKPPRDMTTTKETR